MLSIGEFARATHLSVKTLHHYHDVGVLVPAAVDPGTGYRRYDAGQVPLAHLARRLRDVRMPLDEVRAVLAEPAGPGREALVAGHLERLRRELVETAAAVASLQAMLAAPAAVAVRVRTLPEQRVLAVRDVLSRSEIGPWCAEVFPRLYAGVARIGGTPAGPGGGLYARGWFEDGGGEVTAYVPLAAAPVRETAGPADGRLRLATLPAQRVAAVLHAGSYDDLDLSYGLLGAEVDRRGDGAEDPIRELYLVSPDAAEAAALRTEICWPLTPEPTPEES